jgi:hypothetical protein
MFRKSAYDGAKRELRNNARVSDGTSDIHSAGRIEEHMAELGTGRSLGAFRKRRWYQRTTGANSTSANAVQHFPGLSSLPSFIRMSLPGRLSPRFSQSIDGAHAIDANASRYHAV